MSRADRRLRMSLDEAERIVDQADAGRLDTSDADVQHVVDDANVRISRSLLWGAAQDPVRRRTWQVVIGGGLLLATGLSALLVPLALGLSAQ